MLPDYNEVPHRWPPLLWRSYLWGSFQHSPPPLFMPPEPHTWLCRYRPAYAWRLDAELGPHRRNCDHSRIGDNMFDVQDDPSTNYSNDSGIAALSRIKF
jgi:hypothetical protein